MKKLLLTAIITSIIATHGVAVAEKKESGTAWIHIWNNTPKVLKVKFHVGPNMTKCFYSNVKLKQKFGHRTRMTGDYKCAILPGKGVTLSARWGKEKVGNITSKIMVPGKPIGIIFETANGKKYYLSHKDSRGYKALASLNRYVEVKQTETGGLKERWYFGLGKGQWNVIPELRKDDLEHKDLTTQPVQLFEELIQTIGI